MKLLKSEKTVAQIVRYGMIGVLTFCVDISVLLFATYLLHLSTQFGVTLSFICATALHFTLNKMINFRSDVRGTAHQLRTYTVTVLISYVSTLILMTIFVDYLILNVTVAKALTVLINALWGFPAQKYLTFSKGIRKAISKWLHV